MTWLNKARHLDAPKERVQKKYSNSWRFRIAPDTVGPKDILILPGSFSNIEGDVQGMPFWQTLKHYFYDPQKKKFRSFMCGKAFNKECYACHRQYDKDDKRLQIRKANLWPVVHLDWHYRVENEYGDAPYFVQAENRAQEREFDDLETHRRVFGRPGFMELGKGHQEMLLDILSNVVSQCVGCLEHDFDANGKIEVCAWSCSSCGTVLEDIETTTLNRDEWRKFGQSRKTCTSCRTKDFPKEVVGCTQCPTAIRTEIYDVVIPLVKQGSGKDTSINLGFGMMPKYIDEYDVYDLNGNKVPLLDRMDGNVRIYDKTLQEQVINYLPNLKNLLEVEAEREFQEDIIIN